MQQPDVQNIRSTIRAHKRGERDALAPDVRHRWSGKIIERLHNYLSEKPCHSIHSYISFRSEVETDRFIERALSEGIRVTVPIVKHIGERTALSHTEITGLGNLKTGYFGVQEPVEHHPVSLASLDVVLVPLVAFDRHGTRLGYGKGFYDVFLLELPRHVERIGLAFSIQETDLIPRLPHDEALDTIVTEQEIIHIPTH